LAVVLKRGDEASLSIRVHFWLLFSENPQWRYFLQSLISVAWWEAQGKFFLKENRLF